MKEQFLEKFNSTLKDLTQELKGVLDKDICEAIDDSLLGEKLSNDPTTSDFLEYYYSHSQDVGIELSEKNEIVFSKEITLLPGLDLHIIWNSDLSDSTRDSLWKYLHTLYIYADNYTRNTSLPEVMKQYKNATDKEHLEVDRQTQIMYGILGNLCGDKLKQNNEKTLANKSKGRKSKGKKKKKKSSSGGGSFPLPDNGLFGGEIGKLATEIAGEIDTSAMDLDNPGEMMKGLLSGNMSEDSPMIKLVQQISGKIQNKLSSGDVNEMELFSEAQGVLKSMGNSGSDNDNSPFSILNNLTQQMGGTEGMMDFSNLEKAGFPIPTQANQPSNPVTNPKASNLQERKRILKEKLRQKKELLANKKRLDQLQKGK